MISQFTRRDFVKISAGSMAAAALLASSRRLSFAQGSNGVSPALRKFITPLRGLGSSGIPVAVPNVTAYPGVDYYQISLGQFTDHLHPDLPNPTRLYGYWDTNNPVKRHLGGAIVGQSGRPTRIRFTHASDPADRLPASHILPVDTSIMGAGPDDLQCRASVHLHGGYVPWPSDGGPHNWFAVDPVTGNKVTGDSRVDWLPDGSGTLTDDNWYPNEQSARLLFYHDHAIGITRLNVYAGLASAYIIRDDYEQGLIDSGAIPGAIPGTEIPLVIQDKRFKRYSDDWGVPGDLWYPSIYDTEVFPLEPPEGAPPAPVPSVSPEFFGDTMLVNGTPYPFVEVEPRRYRFRILNACQSAFLNLQLYYASNADPTMANWRAAGPEFLQIGTEGGFLPRPVAINNRRLVLRREDGNPFKYSLLLGPAERADVIVDFSAVPVGSRLVLFNDAPGPFPGGDPAVAATTPGVGPDTMNVLQFRVVPLGTVTGDDSPDPAAPPLTLPRVPALTAGGVTRNVTLNEGVDEFGRVTPILGTLEDGPLAYHHDATETPAAGSTEVWNIFNLTEDAHPIHIHLVNFQILGRAPIDPESGEIRGRFRSPDANERGWKDTVRANFGEVVRVIMRFDLPPAPAGATVPPSPRTGGHEYVWHCHILEHEEHDMMRPLIVE